jgi:preprotein translocase subunit SecY
VKKFIQTLKNIWGIEELKSKIIVTLSFIFIYRFGTYIVLPGIDPNKLGNLTGAKNGALGLIDAFSGGAFLQASVFALGIMPYISASIFMQLMTENQSVDKIPDGSCNLCTVFCLYNLFEVHGQGCSY